MTKAAVVNNTINCYYTKTAIIDIISNVQTQVI